MCCFIKLTLQWLLHDSALKNLKILTCQELLNTEINGVNILDNPDSIQWIKPGELVLTTGYIFINNSELQENTIKGLKEAGCVALCMKTRRFFNEIPQFMKQVSEQYHLPLIELPLQYSLADVSEEVTKNIYELQFYEAAREQTLFNALFNSYFEGKLFRETLQILSDYLNCSVFVLENFQAGDWFALSSKDASILSDHSFEFTLLPETMTVPEEKRNASVQFQNYTRTAALVPFSNPTYTLCVLSEHPEELPWSTLSQAVKILDFSRRSRTIHHSRVNNYFDSLFRFLMHQEHTSESFCLQICEYYGIPHSSNSICMLITSSDSSFDTQNAASVCRHILKQLAFIPSSFFTAWNTNFVYLSFFPGKDPSLPEKFHRFMKELKFKEHTIYGISRPDGNSLQKAFEEASFMLSLAKIFPEQHCFYFPDYIIFWEVSKLSFEERNSIYQMTVKPLVEFDIQHHADLIQTLFTYCQCHFNASIAAKQLFIHRNTFLNRIHKIETLIDLDINNFHRLFSIYYGLCSYFLSLLP